MVLLGIQIKILECVYKERIKKTWSAFTGDSRLENLPNCGNIPIILNTTTYTQKWSITLAPVMEEANKVKTC